MQIFAMCCSYAKEDRWEDFCPTFFCQTLTKVFATVSALIFAIGKASGQRVYLSTQVRQYLFPSELGSEPTRSMCTCSNLADGGKKFAVGLITCLLTFAL